MTPAEKRQCFKALTELVENNVEEGDHKEMLVKLILSVQLHPPGVGLQIGPPAAAAASSTPMPYGSRNPHGRFTHSALFPSLPHEQLVELVWLAAGNRKTKLPGDLVQPVVDARRQEKVKREILVEGEAGVSCKLKKIVKNAFDADLMRLCQLFRHRISGATDGNQTAEFPNSVRKCPDCHDSFRFGVTQLGAKKKNVQLAGLQVRRTLAVSSPPPQLT